MNRALAQFARLLQPLNRRILDVVARAVVKRLDDSKRVQLAQLGILDGETRDAVERFQNYGFTSVPLEGAEAVVLSVGGHRDHCLVVAVDDRRHRLRDLEPGEVAVFHKDGSRVHLKADGSVEAVSKGGAKATLKADGSVENESSSGSKVTLSGDIKLSPSGVVELGSAATDGALKGTSFASASTTFLTALSTYVSAIKAVADPSNAATPPFLAAITAFGASVNSAVSAKVKVQ